MLENLIKKTLFQKIRDFQSFILLLCLVTITIFIINLYEKFKTNQIKDFKNILQNTYLQKTLISVSKSLEPRFETINYVVSSGESFEKILDEIEIESKEKTKFLNYFLNKKLKIKIYKNKKITFEIDNLKNRKITKIVIPINKKKDLIISYNKSNKLKTVELSKELSLNLVYKENFIKNSLYKSAIDKNIDPNIIVQFAQIYGFQVDFQRDIRKNDSFQIVFEEFKNDNNKTVDYGNILYANLILQGKSLELYHFNSEKEKINDHFEANGQSIKKNINENSD